MKSKAERAQEIWGGKPLPFTVEREQTEDGDDLIKITCTTAAAQMLDAILPPEWTVIHPPEFLGWEPEHIAEKLPDSEPEPPDAIDGVLHEHLLFVLNRYRNDALFEAETMPNNRKHAVQGLTESAELTRRLIHIVEKMEVKG
jgi:hypothetical protein